MAWLLAQNDKKLLYCPKLKVEKAGPKATKQEKAKLEKDFNTKCWNQAKVRLPYCAAHCPGGRAFAAYYRAIRSHCRIGAVG